MNRLQLSLREDLLYAFKQTSKAHYADYKSRAFEALSDLTPSSPYYPFKRMRRKCLLLSLITILLDTAGIFIWILRSPDTEHIPPDFFLAIGLWGAFMALAWWLARLSNKQNRLFFEENLAEAKNALAAYDVQIQQAMRDLHNSERNPVRCGCLDCGTIFDAKNEFFADCPNCGNNEYIVIRPANEPFPTETFQNLYRFLNDEE